MLNKERVWFKCQMCNGNKLIIWYEDNKGTEQPCPECDGNGGWWLVMDHEDYFFNKTKV